jgi:hypothetical protein
MIFGLKTNHLATLRPMGENSPNLVALLGRVDPTTRTKVKM